jgi:hypothetical protein
MFGKKDLIKMAGNIWKEESHQLRSHEGSVAEPNAVTSTDQQNIFRCWK